MKLHPGEPMSFTEIEKALPQLTRAQISSGCNQLKDKGMLTKLMDAVYKYEPQTILLDEQPQLPLNGSPKVSERVGTLDVWRDEDGRLFIGVAANFLS